MLPERHIQLFFPFHGSSCPEDGAITRKEVDRLIVEPVGKSSLLELLSSWEPLDDTFHYVDEGLLPPDDVEL